MRGSEWNGCTTIPISVTTDKDIELEYIHGIEAKLEKEVMRLVRKRKATRKKVKPKK